MDFTACIAHGYTTELYMSAETVNHGSDFCIEVLCRTIQKVWEICKQTGRQFPSHLVIQSDNTVAQAKNQYVTIFLAYLVLAGIFQTTNLFFLRVGHTHEATYMYQRSYYYYYHYHYQCVDSNGGCEPLAEGVNLWAGSWEHRGCEPLGWELGVGSWEPKLIQTYGMRYSKVHSELLKASMHTRTHVG